MTNKDEQVVAVSHFHLETHWGAVVHNCCRQDNWWLKDVVITVNYDNLADAGFCIFIQQSCIGCKQVMPSV